MALSFVPSAWSQVKLGLDRDLAGENPFMSPHEQRFGHEFLGLLLPLGAKVQFRPPTPVLKAQHKFAPRTRAGIFLGWHMLMGGRWSGDYLVGDLQDFEAGAKNVRIYQIKELVQPEVIELPFKEIY